jgi:hypothetical protein
MKAMIELVSDHKPGDTLEAHTEGNGDPNAILFRVRERLPWDSGTTVVAMTLNKDDVRTLFNWLGAWLHGAQVR